MFGSRVDFSSFGISGYRKGKIKQPLCPRMSFGKLVPTESLPKKSPLCCSMIIDD